MGAQRVEGAQWEQEAEVFFDDGLKKGLVEWLEIASFLAVCPSNSRGVVFGLVFESDGLGGVECGSEDEVFIFQGQGDGSGLELIEGGDS